MSPLIHLKFINSVPSCISHKPELWWSKLCINIIKITNQYKISDIKNKAWLQIISIEFMTLSCNPLNYFVGNIVYWVHAYI